MHMHLMDMKNVSRDVQSLANNSLILDGSTSNDWRLAVFQYEPCWLRLAGAVMKLFLLRWSRHSNQDNELRSQGSTPSSRLQSLKFNFFREYRIVKEDSHNPSVGDEHKDKARFLDLDSSPLHPATYNTWSFVKRARWVPLAYHFHLLWALLNIVGSPCHLPISSVLNNQRE